MGWWWSTRGAEKPIQPASSASSNFPASNHEQPPPPEHAPTPTVQQVEPLTQKRALTPDEQSEQDLMSWLRELEAETATSKPSDRKQQSSIASSTKTSPEDISPDSLYPTDISCRSAFDYAFFCQSFGGQFVNVYRYGGFRSCSNHWDDFWLCMRTRQWDENDRKKAIQEHYRKRAIKYKIGPSSEDVWQVRTTPVRDAFQGNLEELERQIEEWKRANPDSKAPWNTGI